MGLPTNKDYLKALVGAFPEFIWRNEEPYGLLTIEVDPLEVHTIISWLKSHTELDVNYLTNIAGVEYPDELGREFAVVYQLHSWKNNLRIRIKAFLPKDKIQIQTLTDIFPGANWMERETFDFFGIEFLGHPNLKRILNMDDMDYFPMRKEYVLEDETRKDKDDRYFGRSNEQL